MPDEETIDDGFAFRCDLLRPGDVLLCTTKNDFIGFCIRQATDGLFSHAAICTIRPLFIEADFPGVAEFSLNRLHVWQKDCVRILRLHSWLPDADGIAHRAAEAALRYQAREYDKIAAFASVMGGARASSGIFCSYLAASAYRVAGLHLTGKDAAVTTPADLQHCGYFENITASVLVPARLSDNGIHYFIDKKPQFPAGTDAPAKHTPAQEYNIELRGVTQRVSEFLISKDLAGVESYFEAMEALVTQQNQDWFPELDQLFYSLLQERALPVLKATRPVLDDARKKDEVFFEGVLAKGDLNHPSWRLTVIDVEQRIKSTVDLIEDRNRSIANFKLMQGLRNLKFFAPIIEAEELIHYELVTNNLMYESRLNQFLHYGKDRGWPDPCFS